MTAVQRLLSVRLYPDWLLSATQRSSMRCRALAPRDDFQGTADVAPSSARPAHAKVCLVRAPTSTFDPLLSLESPAPALTCRAARDCRPRYAFGRPRLRRLGKCRSRT